MNYKNSSQMENIFKGSKGKWSLSKQNVRGRQMVDLGDFKGHIDVWHHNGDSMTAEEAKANAQLISKAPELLAELKHLVKALKAVSSFGATKPIIENAERLIKEATEI